MNSSTNKWCHIVFLLCNLSLSWIQSASCQSIQQHACCQITLCHWRTLGRFIAPSQRLWGSTQPWQRRWNCWGPKRRQCRSVADTNESPGASVEATPRTNMEDAGTEGTAGAVSGDNVDPHMRCNSLERTARQHTKHTIRTREDMVHTRSWFNQLRKNLFQS